MAPHSRLPLAVMLLCLCATEALTACVPGADSSANSADAGCPVPEQIRYEVKRVIRRGQPGFTEGLIFHDGNLYESTGEYGSSTLNRIDPQNGKVSVLATLARDYFGEGLDYWNGAFLQLTWKENTAFLWSPDFSAWPASETYRWEGWGLTHDGTHWITSDGSSTLRFLNPPDLAPARSLTIRLGAQPLERLNELEFRNGRILANVFPSKEIVRIDPTSGCVDGVLDLSLLNAYFTPAEAAALKNDPDAVANGIAFDPSTGLTYVTGKNWPLIFELVF